MSKMTAVFFLALLPSFLIGQEALIVTPERPTAGSMITLTYQPSAKGAAITAPASLSAQLLAVGREGMPEMIEVPMAKQGASFIGTTTLGDRFAIYFVQMADGDKLDNNNDHLWTVLVHGKDGNPVSGAHYARGQSYYSGRALMLKFVRDPKKAAEDLQEEVRLYPNDIGPRVMLWTAQLQATPGDATKEHVKQELEVVYEKVKENEKDVLALLRAFEMTGQGERAKTLRAEWGTKNPKGAIAESDAWQSVFREREPVKRFVAFEKTLTDFPPKASDRAMRDQQYINFALAANEIDKAVAKLGSMEKPLPDLYNTLAWRFIEKGERLEEAAGWAKTGVDLARKNEPADKIPYYTQKQWESMWANRLGMILDTYGYGLDQLGKKDEAIAAYAEAFTLLKAADDDVNLRYLSALVGARRFQEAMAAADESVRKGRSSDKILEQYKSAYVAVNGSEKGFEAKLSSAQTTAKKAVVSKVEASMIDKPAPDFTLLGFDGKPVSLSKLRGKVVVVDFWATWCGPCIQSFPHLQKVYEKYQKNANVVILAVNTWEREQGEARDKTVRKFIADKQYTFPVLFDDNNTTVTAYGVEGIPTKFIIDKNGHIRFKDIGFSGGAEMIEKMDAQFDILLKN